MTKDNDTLEAGRVLGRTAALVAELITVDEAVGTKEAERQIRLANRAIRKCQLSALLFHTLGILSAGCVVLMLPIVLHGHWSAIPAGLLSIYNTKKCLEHIQSIGERKNLFTFHVQQIHKIRAKLLDQ